MKRPPQEGASLLDSTPSVLHYGRQAAGMYWFGTVGATYAVGAPAEVPSRVVPAGALAAPQRQTTDRSVLSYGVSVSVLVAICALASLP